MTQYEQVQQDLRRQIQQRREQVQARQQTLNAVAEQVLEQQPGEREQLNLLAEEQVLGIAMAWKGECGMSGLRAISPEEFSRRPVHAVIARNILDLADRGYHHDANAVSKLVAIRQQTMPWDFRGPVREIRNGKERWQPTSSYLGKLQSNAQQSESSLYYAAAVRNTYRQDYQAATGVMFRELGKGLESAAQGGQEDSWSVTQHLEQARKQVMDRIDLCPPSLEPLLKTSVGHDQLQRTLTAVASRSRDPLTVTPAGTSRITTTPSKGKGHS